MMRWLNPDGIDWTTTACCPRCDTYGPFAPWGTLAEQYRDAHQAWHAIVAAMVVPIVRLSHWLDGKVGA